MTRTPLRPLARILAARRAGENPDAIERANLAARHEADRDEQRQRAEGRLLVLGIVFLCAFFMVGMKMSVLAASDPAEPRALASGAQIVAARADITDRNGRILATNLTTHSLYAQPPQMIDPERSAHELAAIFPDLDADKLVKLFTGKRKFIWIKRRISPEQQQAVFDIGDPGLLFGPREMRLYPNGHLAAHILGGAGFGREGVTSAELIGVAGIERAMDETLSDPGRGDVPLRLSLDLTVQAAVERVLAGGMRLMNAKGAAAILMDAQNGEILAMASLPDFDPNDRPRPLVKGDPAESPLFNRAVQGVYELGSTFKVFAAAQAIEERLVSRSTWIDTKGPLTWGRHRIHDLYDHGPALTVEDVIVESSNIGTARIAMMIGPERQQDFLGRLGLFSPTQVELIEAPGAKPLLPKTWSEIHAMTISYGHGMSASPLHLATAYASLLNGGHEVKPTLLIQEAPVRGRQVVSENTSQQMREFLRQVVQRGTATLAEVPGYRVAGKTGTADKPKPQGGYYEDKVIATFAGVFPADDPRYVLVVTLDEPVETSGSEPRRTAGWTAVPVAAEVIRRAAPLLGLAPGVEPSAVEGVTLARN
ncbi:penicillin-binding protein 2 [Silicimonas algicola]|uniref:Cell division protein FtsI (Penicillin-binding protein 3) n=1 Tax=Silicimonas algicola TaxID=1826607 RepID=A0A316GEP9_9RHOB|nr:penicillin-binding protein 2 [Silicimonas algicola]AZQ66373.1 penicillin-binding protein 2 [Silicimonas algicola]PWK58705.1 cell division protein FtsI (penicillin-binding protein 3) [Silicimonas algicola]